MKMKSIACGVLVLPPLPAGLWCLVLGVAISLSGCVSFVPREYRPEKTIVGDLGMRRVDVPRFRDVTALSGLSGCSGRRVNWVDYDNDQYPDLLVDGSRLFRNCGAPHFNFIDVTASVGLAAARGAAAVCFDYDNDGWTDIVTTRGGLWHNEKGVSFQDVASSVGFKPHAKAGVLGCGDVNADGYADVFVGMKEDWNNGHPTYYPAELWLNSAGTRFREIGHSAGIDRKTYARAVLFSDVDGDGRQDIFIGNYRLQPNLLWRNRGKCRFKNVAHNYGVAGNHDPGRYLDPIILRRYGPHWGHTIGACWLDFDNDAKLDLFTANLVHKYVGPSSGKQMQYDVRGYVCDDSAIYRRCGNTFSDWRASLGVARMPMGGPAFFKGDELWSGCVAADVNNDGWMDIFVPQVYNLDYAKAKLFINAAGQQLIDKAAAAGIQRIDTYAGAWADIDRDGDVDLATAGRSGVGCPVRLCLLRNEGKPDADANRWLKVRLEQGNGRHTMLGTGVTVQAGKLRLYQEFGAGTSSYGQQNESTLHFGLGNETEQIAVIVRWPDGKVVKTFSSSNTVVEVSMP